MSQQCTCTTDKEATCIVHPTTRSLKERIADCEAIMAAQRFRIDALQKELSDSWRPIETAPRDTRILLQGAHGEQEAPRIKTTWQADWERGKG